MTQLLYWSIIYSIINIANELDRVCSLNNSEEWGKELPGMCFLLIGYIDWA